MTRARRGGLVAAHSGCAARAFSTTERTSALEASATWAWTSPVIGSKTSADRPEVPLTSRPPTKCPIVRMRSSRGLDGKFGPHLAVLAAFGKRFHARRFCENAGVTTNVACSAAAGLVRSMPRGRFPGRALRRLRAAERRLAAGGQNLVGKFAAAGDAGHH